MCCAVILCNGPFSHFNLPDFSLYTNIFKWLRWLKHLYLYLPCASSIHSPPLWVSPRVILIFFCFCCCRHFLSPSYDSCSIFAPHVSYPSLAPVWELSSPPPVCHLFPWKRQQGLRWQDCRTRMNQHRQYSHLKHAQMLHLQTWKRHNKILLVFDMQGQVRATLFCVKNVISVQQYSSKEHH